MRVSRRSTSSRVLRAVRHAIFDESRHGRAAEIVAWSNAASSLTIAAGATALGWSRLGGHAAWLGLVVGAVMLVVLRLALTNCNTVWIASALGTLTVGGLGGSLFWLFAHVVDIAALPAIAGVIGAVASAALPAWSYGQLAQRRAHDRDSLLDPISVPHSR